MNRRIDNLSPAKVENIIHSEREDILFRVMRFVFHIYDLMYWGTFSALVLQTEQDR